MEYLTKLPFASSMRRRWILLSSLLYLVISLFLFSETIHFSSSRLHPPSSKKHSSQLQSWTLPSLHPSSQQRTFELIDSQLWARLTEATQENLLELQITRQTTRVTTDVFFTPAFVSFLKLRFLCQDIPQIQTVKNSLGDIPDVLAFTSTILLFDTLPRNQLSFNFNLKISPLHSLI